MNWTILHERRVELERKVTTREQVVGDREIVWTNEVTGKERRQSTYAKTVRVNILVKREAAGLASTTRAAHP